MEPEPIPRLVSAIETLGGIVEQTPPGHLGFVTEFAELLRFFS